MERTYAPLIRQFSSIKGYQAAYTLVYALDASEGGCRLTLDRKGEREQQVSEFVPLHPEAGYRLLQYLCENAVQPEIWGAAIIFRSMAFHSYFIEQHREMQSPKKRQNVSFRYLLCPVHLAFVRQRKADGNCFSLSRIPPFPPKSKGQYFSLIFQNFPCREPSGCHDLFTFF